MDPEKSDIFATKFGASWREIKKGNLFYLFAAIESTTWEELGVHLTQNKILHILSIVPYLSVAICQFSIFESWISRLEAPNFWSRNGSCKSCKDINTQIFSCQRFKFENSQILVI